MVKKALIGTQFGDESKGKMEDYLLAKESYGVVGRYRGGRNAGHTQVDNDREVINHLVPCGILKPDIYNIILSGVLVDPLGLAEEINELREMGYKVDPSNLGVSNRAQVTLQYHRDFERKQEKRKGRGAIGTTMRAIGPTAVTAFNREGLRLGEFVEPEYFYRFLRSLPGSYENVFERMTSLFKRSGNMIAKNVDVKNYMEMYENVMNFLRPFVVDEADILENFRDKNWLYEGAQGVLLDVLVGTIPYVTSSEAAMAPPDTDEIIGVMKAYITRVGGGNLPTRMEPEDERRIRGVRGKTPGAEFGATTGRPRNCGWFDAFAAKFAVREGRVHKVALTKLDRLDGLPSIKVATAYKYKGSVLRSFPAERYVFERVEPVYRELPGWNVETIDCRELGELPQNTRDYVKWVEDTVERKIRYISIGQKDEQTIEL